jgi:hypothetical protein
MCVLCMGCLLWWMRSGSATAFWSWTATGVAMVGLHSLGWGIIGVQVAFIALWPRREGQTLLRFIGGYAAFALGLMIIAAGPLVYYLSFNRWGKNIEDRGWDASGIAWIKQFFSTDPMFLVRDTTNHFLFGYDYPPPALSGVVPTWAWYVTPMIPMVLLVVLAICLYPFPRRARGRGVSTLPTQWWRTAFWLSAWLLLPAYGFYCASFSDYAWPHQVIGKLLSRLVSTPPALVTYGVLAICGVYFCAPSWPSRGRKLLQLLVVSAGILLLGYGIAAAMGGRSPGPRWVSRYLGFVWPAFVISLFALLGRLPKIYLGDA